MEASCIAVVGHAQGHAIGQHACHARYAHARETRAEKTRAVVVGIVPKTDHTGAWPIRIPAWQCRRESAAVQPSAPWEAHCRTGFAHPAPMSARRSPRHPAPATLRDRVRGFLAVSGDAPRRFPLIQGDRHGLGPHVGNLAVLLQRERYVVNEQAAIPHSAYFPAGSRDIGSLLGRMAAAALTRVTWRRKRRLGGRGVVRGSVTVTGRSARARRVQQGGQEGEGGQQHGQQAQQQDDAHAGRTGVARNGQAAERGAGGECRE